MATVVGRKDELDAIDGFLESIEGGRAPVMLLSGMAGIGKTTLWNAGVGSAKDRSYRVVTARPTEVETGLAFASLGDLLTPLLDAAAPDLPGPQREALDAALLRVSAASPPQPLGVSLGALHLLRAAAREAPLLLAIDDVPWLDDASARVLDFSIRRLEADRVGFLLARRAASPDEPLPAWLTTLPPDRMTRQDVPPLSVDETAALLREHLGLNLSRPVLTRLHAISGGTPFYALELGRDLQRRGDRATPESLAVPRSLEGLVGARVAALDPAADDVALYAAALAQPTVRALEAALGTERVTEGLEGAVAAGVLETADDGIRFAHPLLAAATYSRATPSRRREVHERLAGFATEPEERARHLARTAIGPDRSIATALDDGAAAAARRGAPEVAAALAEEADRLTPSDAVDDRHRRRIGEAEYLFGAGDAKRADAILTLVATELAPGSALGHVLARRATLALMFADLDAADALFREAMPMASDDPRLRIAIHNGLAGIGYLSWRGWRRARLDMFLALRLAQELGDPAIEVQALGHTASWLSSLGRPWRHLLERADSLDVPREAVPILEHPDMQFSRILSYHGDAAEGRRRIQRLIEHARASGDWTSISRLLAVLAEIEFDAGDIDEAERIASGAYAGILQTGEGAFHQDILATRLHLLVLRGDVETARILGAEVEPVAEASAYPWFRTTVQVSLAMLDHSVGEAAAAYERFARVMSIPGLGRLAALHWETIVAHAVECLVS